MNMEKMEPFEKTEREKGLKIIDGVLSRHFGKKSEAGSDYMARSDERTEGVHGAKKMSQNL